ncbi:MAG: carboxylesterase family protein [Acidobacteriia bacterium]|nr:carboxylesterase family protein [Terriglobia bacterium]
MSRSEDCLYLNVWTLAASNNEKLPVLVWIYGGGGVNGSSAESFFDGNAMAKKGVVVVSMNYRVNVFGCLLRGCRAKRKEGPAGR